jgi:hypothetical protein
MIKEKQFDCVKFKNELHENLLKKSGAKSLREYVEYVNKMVKTSTLYKNNQIDCKNADGT